MVLRHCFDTNIWTHMRYFTMPTYYVISRYWVVQVSRSKKKYRILFSSIIQLFPGFTMSRSAERRQIERQHTEHGLLLQVWVWNQAHYCFNTPASGAVNGKAALTSDEHLQIAVEQEVGCLIQAQLNWLVTSVFAEMMQNNIVSLTQ